MKIVNASLALMIFFCSLAFAEVYLTAEEATHKIFPSLEEFKTEDHLVDGQEFKVFTVFAKGKVVGWTVKVNEMGKIKPITFLVGIDNQGKVLEVYLLEYRDMFGAEIRRRSFLRQFQKKALNDPLSIGRDIDAVTGATISSQAATLAVKKPLQMVEKLRKGS